jgi:hypothetical protein
MATIVYGGRCFRFSGAFIDVAPHWRSEMASFAEAFREREVAEEEISRQAALLMHAVQLELRAAFAVDELDASA